MRRKYANKVHNEPELVLFVKLVYGFNKINSIMFYAENLHNVNDKPFILSMSHPHQRYGRLISSVQDISMLNLSI